MMIKILKKDWRT